ncbi:hypothetical protein like AT4G29090 [Hibiscus trionum]|uniref:RNase H type-1 domain-containing protein n=1 Tax=Hibiscus trionum TaxID=183268 RepID=A0A9W7IX34_HIBTR|nr:hypothetical protein like AT4G29090 [Hibiscus trionum]
MPTTIANKLNGLIARFLWGGSADRCMHWIRWETVCKPMKYGGLGIRDLKTKNRALLNKWIWRYGGEKGSMWRSVIDAKYNLDNKRLIPNVNIDRRTFWIWRNIAKPLCNQNDLFTKGLKTVFGDGSSIDFWNDFWTEVRSLKEAFTRIFMIATKKSGTISDFGSRVNEEWVWNIELGRSLFDWEIEVWREFMDVINRAIYNPNVEDNLRWLGADSGLYSSKGYCDSLNMNDNQHDNVWEEVWKKMAPIKVEALLWKAIHNRLPTMLELSRRRVELNGIIWCPFCRAEPETVNHLLLHCHITWRIWMKWCEKWQSNFIMPRNVKELVQVWPSLSTVTVSKPIWEMVLRAFIWTMWVTRNDIVFNEKSWSVEEIFESALLRTGHWCKIQWPECCSNVCDFMRNPTATVVKTNPKRMPLSIEWKGPKLGWLKYNVDPAIKGVDRSAGIGGILRNQEGAKLEEFSKSIGRADPTQAEMLSILEACKMYEKSQWCGSHSLIIESNCELAIKWIKEPNSCPTAFASLAKIIADFFNRHNWSLVFNYREANDAAHELAKQGVSCNDGTR